MPDTRTAISFDYARWQLLYGDGDAAFVEASREYGWRVALWLAEQDDLDYLEDLALEERLGGGMVPFAEGWAPLKDCHWRDTEFRAGGGLPPPLDESLL